MSWRVHVDEAALAAALHSGHLAGAALDVYENEPMVNASLLEAENILLQPHRGTGTRVGKAMNSENMMRNVLTVLRDGLPPLTPVNAPASPRLTAASMGPVGRAAKL